MDAGTSTAEDIGVFAHGPLARLRAWWHALRERRRLRDEFAALEAYGQLDTILQEAGATRGVIDAILRAHPDTPQRLAAMLKRLGISRDRLRAAGAQHDVEFTCTICETTGKCEHWLRSGKASGYEAFCPNAETFKSLQTKQ
ncbi:MAG TPA: DUF6455 family protein [Stellaceae bacterium]|nr:DUF6455 family protein [Stellaceae bacterium]